jgi:hypothetical protein
MSEHRLHPPYGNVLLNPSLQNFPRSRVKKPLYGVEYVDYPLGQRIVRLRPARSKEASLAGEQSACRSQIKLMYGSHHQQPQKECRYDELDPYLVVREPSMHMIEPIHGQPPSGYHAPPSPIHYHIHGR